MTSDPTLEFNLITFADRPPQFRRGNIVAVLIDVDLRVKSTGRRITEEDEVHIWYFDAQGRVSRFGHKVDTHQRWIACGGEPAKG